MKIKPKTQDLQSLQSDSLSDAVRLKLTKAAEKNPQVKAALDSFGSDGSTVNLGIGRLINQQLDPQAFAAERKARVEELKKLVQSGQYKPDSQKVASATANEILTEILTNPSSPE